MPKAPACFVVALALCAACHKPPPKPRPPEVVLGGETMGSTYTIKVAVDDEADVARAQALQTRIDETLEHINDVMSTYRPSSEISRFNAHKSLEPFAASSELVLVVTKAIEIGKATDGAYDITIDPLISLWGFDRKGRRNAPPTAEEIAAARAHVGLDKLVVEGGALKKLDPELTINLGGIASGYAVDVVAAMLEAERLPDYMVEITGEVRAHGRNARLLPWKIGVKVPRSDDDPTAVAAAVPLIDRALTTSGSYHNFFESGGKRYSHILDPKTAAPIDTDLVSVTVLYGDALTADGFDTPFMILGEERARAIAAQHPGMEVLFIHAAAPDAAHPDAAADQAGFRVSTTKGFPPIERPTTSSSPASEPPAPAAPAPLAPPAPAPPSGDR